MRPFSPSLVAGTSNSDAGAYSSFTLKLDREDGDQFLGKLNFTMPPGLTANLHGRHLLSRGGHRAAANNAGRAEQARTELPAASSRSGPRTSPRAPAPIPSMRSARSTWPAHSRARRSRLVAITPALAGPYDYGTVVVRVALHIDPQDAHVIADSETVPAIIGGIPIRMRSIQVNIDKPNFMINPTNCSPFSVASQGIGDQGTVANFSSYFQAVNCFTLPFSPRMTVTQLGGHKATPRGQGPRACSSTSNTSAGDANIKSVAVTLPKAFEIDQSHLATSARKPNWKRSSAPDASRSARSKTETPLLEKPLSKALPTRSRATAGSRTSPSSSAAR